MSTDVTFLEQTPFASSGSISPGEEDDLLIYTFLSPSSDLPSSAPVKPPIQ